MQISCPKCKINLLFIATTGKFVCGNKNCKDYNRRQFGGNVDEEE